MTAHHGHSARALLPNGDAADPPAPVLRRGVRGVLVGLVVAVAAATAVSMALLWPSGDAPTRSVAGAYEGIDVHRAEVVSTERFECPGISEDRLPDGTIPATVDCASLDAVLLEGPDAGDDVRVDVPVQVLSAGAEAGAEVDLARYPDVGGEPAYVWLDFSRGLPLVLLGVAFAVLVVGVARLRGLAAIVGLGLGYATVVGFMLPALRDGASPVAVAVTGAVAIMTVVLYLAHGFTLKTTAALLGTVSGLLLTAGLASWAVSAAHLTGLGTEEGYDVSFLTGQDDLSGIVLCGIIVAGLGVLNDVTITQSSAVVELRAGAPWLGARDLFAAGMRIGRDHLASTVYTIAFAYAGAALPTLILIDLYDQPWEQVLTSGPIAEEIVRTLVGSISLVLAIPLTTAVAAAAVARLAVVPGEDRPAPA